jgi:hypothetical protein
VKYRILHTSISLICLISLNLNLLAQKLTIRNPDLFYQISSVYDFKQSIVSLTFDDGSVNQFLVALPILKEKKIPATFYLITDMVDGLIKSILLENASPDYEIGSHTSSHQHLKDIGLDEARMELENSQSFLQNLFGKNAGLTMSYPWGEYNKQVLQLAKKSFLAARTTDPGYNSLNILQRYTLKTKSFEQQTSLETANSWIDFAIQNDLWLIEMIHGIDGIGFSPIDSKKFSEHLDYLNKVKENIWCTTVSNVIKYIDEAQNTTITCDVCNDSIYKLRINDNMDSSVYTQALSFRVKIPDDWDNISIAGKAKVIVENRNENKFVLFSEVPNNRTVTIRPASKSVPNYRSGIRLVYLSENPFVNNIRISIEVLERRDIDVILLDLNGKTLLHKSEKNVMGVIDFLFDTSVLSKGLYILRIGSHDNIDIFKKLVKI